MLFLLRGGQLADKSAALSLILRLGWSMDWGAGIGSFSSIVAPIMAEKRRLGTGTSLVKSMPRPTGPA